jgi:hypothetical protein
MSAARPSLVYDAAFEEARERRAGDRRRSFEAHADGMKLDPLFAATLVNHVAKPERPIAHAYREARAPRAGIAIDFRA